MLESAAASYMAFVYGQLLTGNESSVAHAARTGLIYLVLTTLPMVYQGQYHERVDIASLHYMALGLGLAVAAQINARAMDRLYAYLGEREGRHRPEARLPSLVPGSILYVLRLHKRDRIALTRKHRLPIGLLLYGWTASAHVFWLVPDIGLFIIGSGMIFSFQHALASHSESTPADGRRRAIQLYVIDAFKLRAASALAAVNCMRALAGFGFPLFAPAMYDRLGVGKGNTVLAACGIALGCPAPWLLWFYGEKLRLMSANAHQHRHEAKIATRKHDEESGVGVEKGQVEAQPETESALHKVVSH